MITNHPVAVTILLVIAIVVYRLRRIKKRRLVENPPVTFEEWEQEWLNKIQALGVAFPVLYRDNDEVPEARGFESLEDLLGDYDTISFDNDDRSILIDQNGKIVSLQYNDLKRLIFPNEIIGTKRTPHELLEYLHPIIKHMLSSEEYDHVKALPDVSEIITYLSATLELE